MAEKSPAQAAPAAAAAAAAAPDFDFYDHMDGIWKRNLEWRHFGEAYQHLRTSNAVVQINKHTSRKDGRRFLTWSFGLDLSQTSMKFGYVMRLEPTVSCCRRRRRHHRRRRRRRRRRHHLVCVNPPAFVTTQGGRAGRRYQEGGVWPFAIAKALRLRERAPSFCPPAAEEEMPKQTLRRLLTCMYVDSAGRHCDTLHTRQKKWRT